MTSMAATMELNKEDYLDRLSATLRRTEVSLHNSPNEKNDLLNNIYKVCSAKGSSIIYDRNKPGGDIKYKAKLNCYLIQRDASIETLQRFKAHLQAK